MIPEPVAKPLVHRRDPKEHRPAPIILARQLGHHRMRPERQQRCAGPTEQGPMQAHAKAVQMEKRQSVNEDVARAPAPDLDRTAALGEEVAVVEKRPLWPSGGAGRVEDGGRAFGCEPGHRRRVAARQVFDRDDSVSELLHGFRARAVRDDKHRLRVVQDVLRLGGVVVRIHHHRASTGALDAEVRDHPFERVGRIDCNPIGGFDAFASQPTGDVTCLGA